MPLGVSGKLSICRMFLKTPNGIVVYDYKRNQSFLFDNTNGLAFQDVITMHYSNFHLLMSRRNAIAYYDLRQLPKNNFRTVPQLNMLIADTTVVFTRETGRGKAIPLTHKAWRQIFLSPPDRIDLQ